jgi:hypothetical protein
MAPAAEEAGVPYIEQGEDNGEVLQGVGLRAEVLVQSECTLE